MVTINKFVFSILIFFFVPSTSENTIQDFQGKAYYFSKSTLNLGGWGARMSEAQKKQMQSRLKNRLEKTFILSFNKNESINKIEKDKQEFWRELGSNLKKKEFSDLLRSKFKDYLDMRFKYLENVSFETELLLINDRKITLWGLITIIRGR